MRWTHIFSDLARFNMRQSAQFAPVTLTHAKCEINSLTE